ncbi:MAG TPA: PRC-barrel domain-containing protein [Sphingomicrobium sp.]|nr:PRC-barrel domain-containing protein [Sphingomicrobium sp.]
MRLSDLRDKKIKTLDGETLGRVHEVHCEKGRVTALMCGPGSFIERLTARKEGRRIPWECVKRVEERAVIVVPDPPQRMPAAKKASGSRTPRRTRQPSGRRSKR